MDIIKFSRTIGKANILDCRLANVETTFQGFAGADYDLQVPDDIFTKAVARWHRLSALQHDLYMDRCGHPILQDALTESTDTKQSQREIDGQTYFDYEIFSPVLFSIHPLDEKRCMRSLCSLTYVQLTLQNC